MKNTIHFIISLIFVFILASCASDTVTTPNASHPLYLTITPSPVLTYRESLLIASPTSQSKENLTVLWSSRKGTIINSNEGFLVKWRAPLYAEKDTLTATINNGSRISEQKFEIDVEFGCGTPIMYMNKSYNTVQIGSQCWLRDNLDVGTMVNGKLTQTNNGSLEKYCMNNDSSYCAKYGGLYQWNEAMAYNIQTGTQGICPSGWHIPTIEDFETLKKEVKDNGNSLKAIGEGEADGRGTNFSGFSMLMAGYRSEDGGLWNLGLFNSYWSSSNIDASTAMAQFVYYGNYTILMKSYNKEGGYSVRCIKN